MWHHGGSQGKIERQSMLAALQAECSELYNSLQNERTWAIAAFTQKRLFSINSFQDSAVTRFHSPETLPKNAD